MAESECLTQNGELSVLVVTMPSVCKSGTSVWLITGITIGVFGLLVVVFGVIWFSRDALMRWMHTDYEVFDEMDY